MWEVEYTFEFGNWWKQLTEAEQTAIAAHVELLEKLGPGLRFPYSSSVRGSRYSQMRELRIQYAGDPYRILYAFDPRRAAILLIGGNKTGKSNWYEKNIVIADKLYDKHLQELAEEENNNYGKII